MCTSFKFKNVMGRNFDYDVSYDEDFIIVPSDCDVTGTKYNFMGVCTGLVKDFPLLYDGMNQFGLCCSGLSFPNNAHYYPYDYNKVNIPAHMFVLEVLGNHKTVKEVKEFLENVNLWDFDYYTCDGDKIDNSSLHWMICDKGDCIVVESTSDGLNVYDNPIGVLTNNPPFNLQKSICEYISLFLGGKEYKKNFPLNNLFETRGLNTYGLKGDYTSIGRFQKASYLVDMMSQYSSRDAIVDGFHILGGVEQCGGVNVVGDKFEHTIYSVVYDMLGKCAYYKTYDDLFIARVELNDNFERFDL